MKSYNTLRIIKKAITIYMLFCIVIECIAFPALENLFGCVVLLYGWLFISRTVLKVDFLYHYFIPFVAIFFYGICFFALPLGVTLIEGKPITFRFNVPYITFFNLMLNVTTIVLAFHTCRRIYKEGWLLGIWKKLGYFKVPTEAQIWAMAGAGIFALLYNITIQGTDMMDAENKGAWGQIMNQMTKFAILPIAMLFPKYYGRKNTAIPRTSLIVYFSFIIFLAIVTTKRTLMFTGIVSWGLMAFLVVLLENKKLFKTKTNILIIIGLYLVTGPVADLATAMILNRQSAYSSKAGETFTNIWKLYSDKEKLHNAYNMASLSNSDNGGDNFYAWSEYYVDNILLDRICNLRTQDLTLDYATKLGYDNSKMHRYAENFLMFQIPTPILDIFGYTTNKFDSNYTPGDLLSTEGLGLKNMYKGFRVAGDSGIGLYWMGYSYYIFAFFIYVLVFYFFSSLVSTKLQFIIPIPIITALLKYMTYFNNSTGIFKSLNLILRNGMQDILLYVILFGVIRLIIRQK